MYLLQPRDCEKLLLYYLVCISFSVLVTKYDYRSYCLQMISQDLFEYFFLCICKFVYQNTFCILIVNVYKTHIQVKTFKFMIFRDERILFLACFNLFSSYSILLTYFIEKELRLGFLINLIVKMQKTLHRNSPFGKFYLISVFMGWLRHVQTLHEPWYFKPEERDEPLRLKRTWQRCHVLLPFTPPETLRSHRHSQQKSHQPAVFEGKTPSCKMGHSSIELTLSKPFRLLCLSLPFQKKFHV